MKKEFALGGELQHLSLRHTQALMTQMAQTIVRRPVKLVKIRFTAWRDQPAAPRSSDFQRKLDSWNQHEHVLRGALLRVRQQQATADSEVLKMEFAAITTELTNIDTARQPLIDAEVAEVEQTQAALLQHKKVGTFGYQVLNDAGTHVGYIVDEAGNHLPTKAVYAYEVVDDDPPLPVWATKTMH